MKATNAFDPIKPNNAVLRDVERLFVLPAPGDFVSLAA